MSPEYDFANISLIWFGYVGHDDSGETLVWSSLTSTGAFEGKPCRFQVLKSSPHLATLASATRSDQGFDLSEFEEVR
jgi:hypothetical protein